jgi:hypothetical protein
MSIGGLEERVIEVCHGWGLYDDENATDFTRFDKLEEEVAELEEALFATGTTYPDPNGSRGCHRDLD